MPQLNLSDEMVKVTTLALDFTSLQHEIQAKLGRPYPEITADDGEGYQVTLAECRLFWREAYLATLPPQTAVDPKAKDEVEPIMSDRCNKCGHTLEDHMEGGEVIGKCWQIDCICSDFEQPKPHPFTDVGGWSLVSQTEKEE